MTDEQLVKCIELREKELTKEICERCAKGQKFDDLMLQMTVVVDLLKMARGEKK